MATFRMQPDPQSDIGDRLRVADIAGL